MRRLSILVVLAACGGAAATVSTPAPNVTASAPASSSASASPPAASSSAPAEVVAPARIANVVCAPTFAEMSKTTSVCALNLQPACNYPQGTCTCVSCPGGHYNPETEGQGFMHCEPHICSTPIVAGTPCATGTSCTVCGGGWTCPNGAWVQQRPARRP